MTSKTFTDKETGIINYELPVLFSNPQKSKP